MAQVLCTELHGEYIRRYGGGDDTRIELDDFAPPNGDFIVAFAADGTAAGCGGWRSHEGDDAEMKRVYVREAVRRRGLARLLVAAIERSAAEAGRKRLILETGLRQPEAVAMYRALGYRSVAPFGCYADAEGSLHLGKELRSDER